MLKQFTRTYPDLTLGIAFIAWASVVAVTITIFSILTPPHQPVRVPIWLSGLEFSIPILVILVHTVIDRYHRTTRSNISHIDAGGMTGFSGNTTRRRNRQHL